MAAEEPKSKEIIIPVKIEEEMKKSYIDYAMSVIVGRALPDVRDGLKPVHRRILYAMQELGNTHDKPYKKAARIVGEVLGKYHPHGDIAVYDALVRMVQDFSMRYPLIDGQGNFGSVDGDEAAAMRYTEVRLAKVAEEMLADIDKNTVNFVPNFDESLQEPSVLPAKLPNLLLNGSSGIAVGMATNVPPHNLGELVDATITLIGNPNASVEEMMEVIKGPDFPTGAFIFGKSGIRDAYANGRGSIKLRARASVEKKKDREHIIVTELPYQVNKAKLLEDIAALVRDKKIEGISDLRDESDREGMRVVIELKGSAVAEIVLNQLYKHTQMETAFGVINLAIVDGEPKVLSLKDAILEYIKHKKNVVTRRCQFELGKAQKRAHILEGLKVALRSIDAVVKIIKGSKTIDAARDALISNFRLSREQSQAILDMRLQRLVALEQEKLEQEYVELLKNIAWLKEVLASEQKLLNIIREELLELKNKYGDARRTEIIEAVPELGMEDLIAEEEMVVVITNNGYIKRLPVTSYKEQRRGGKGVIGMETKEEDFIVNSFVTSTHDFILFFTNRGRCYWLKAYEIPLGIRYSKGRAIINLLPRLSPEEKIKVVMPIKEFNNKHFLVFATKKGMVKKTALSKYSRPIVTGIWAIKLDKDDELIGTGISDGNKEIILATKKGKAIRFDEKQQEKQQVRATGRYSRGVIGIKLREGDEVVSMALAQKDSVLLTITENGYGKRTQVSEYRKTSRGKYGVITLKPTPKSGFVVSVLEVSDADELILTSKEGMVIRTSIDEIRQKGRPAMGVTVMELAPNDKVIAVERLIKD
ncbi:MAG: DNA gyrase subunit A [Methanobacteriota archaeon]